MSGAEIRSVCTEAGYFAIRESRKKISMADFRQAIKKVKTDEKSTEYLKLYGEI